MLKAVVVEFEEPTAGTVLRGDLRGDDEVHGGGARGSELDGRLVRDERGGAVPEEDDRTVEQRPETFEHVGDHRCVDRAWADGVDADAAWRIFDTRAFGHSEHSVFGAVIGCALRQADETAQ